MSRHSFGLVARTNTTEEARILYPLLGPDPVAFINATFVMVTVGQISLIFLLGTLLLSPYVQGRNLTMLNLLALTIFASIPPAILYYSGHVLDPNPSWNLCLTQAIFKHGSDPMFITASLALIVELLVETRLLAIRVRRKVRTSLLVALPYIVFFIFAIWAGALGASNPSIVKHQPNTLYCSVSYVAFGRGIDILCAVIVLFTISIEIFTLVKWREAWQNVKYQHCGSGFSTALVLRLLGFTCLQCFYLCLLALNFFVGAAGTNIIPIAYEALMPFATFLIFGTSMDCLRTWKFWDNKRIPVTQPEDSNPDKSVVDDEAGPKTPDSVTFPSLEKTSALQHSEP